MNNLRSIPLVILFLKAYYRELLACFSQSLSWYFVPFFRGLLFYRLSGMSYLRFRIVKIKNNYYFRICERCQIKSGGIYFLVSKVLGKRIGGAVGIIYTFGQATATGLSALGFGESMTKLFEVYSPVGTKILAIIVLVVLTGK